jgi:hypothetical protein
VRAHTERLQRVAQALHEPGKVWRLRPVVEALQARRGMQCIVAVTTVAALGDLSRVDTPRQLMQCWGLIPAEYARAATRRQGSITKAGHTPARPALVDGAWASRDAATVSRHLQLRREKPPTIIQAIRWQAPVRLGTRDRRLLARGTHATQVVVAMARELVGCMWAMAKAVPVTPSGRLTDGRCTHDADCFSRAAEETQPRFWCHPRRRDTTPRAYSRLARGRHPTDASQVGPHPRRSAGSTVAS